MIGSKKKVNSIFQNLLKKGFRKDDLERAYAPIGLDIGAKTPEEIAISILAEIVLIKNKRCLFLQTYATGEVNGFLPNCKVWIEKDGEKVFGEWPCDILKRIKRTGSLRMAASEINMSYSQAWQLINNLEKDWFSP